MIKNTIRKTLNHLGFEIRRTKTINNFVDLRRENINPIEALYLVGNRDCVINIKLNRLISSNLISIWIKVLNYIDSDESLAKKYLYDYFEKYKPRDVSEVLGIVPNPGQEWLRWHPMTYIMPWQNRNPKRRLIKRIHMMSREASSVDINLGNTYQWKGFGPADNSVVEMEFRRLKRIYTSITKDGFLEDKGIFGAQLLCSGGDYRFRPCDGWHRSAVLKALDYESVPVILPSRLPIIRREECEHWPAVKNGYFTAAQAKTIFDKQMNKL